jgi:hypothetical protein
MCQYPQPWNFANQAPSRKIIRLVLRLRKTTGSVADPKSLFRIRIHNFFSNLDSDPEPNILTEIFSNRKCLICDFSHQNFFYSAWIRIRIQIRNIFSASDPAKTYGFFRIRIHNTATGTGTVLTCKWRASDCAGLVVSSALWVSPRKGTREGGRGTAATPSPPPQHTSTSSSISPCT